MSGKCPSLREKGISFWTVHEDAVAEAGVELAVHLRDILRRPESADVDGFGPFQRVEALLACGETIQRAVADVLEANDSLPESGESNVVFQTAMRALHKAVTPALEFFEAPDLNDASAGREFVETAVLVACTVLSAFASLGIGAEAPRMVDAFVMSMSYIGQRKDKESSEPDEFSSSRKLLVTSDEVLEFSVPGIAALIASDDALVTGLSGVSALLAEYVTSRTLALVDGELTDEARAVSETHARVAVHVLSRLSKAVPAVACEPRVVEATQTAVTALQRFEGAEIVEEMTTELLDVWKTGRSRLMCESNSAPAD